MTRIVQVSDSHLSPRAPHANANWQAVIDYVARSQPDLVVHTGDISLDGASDPAGLEHARLQLDRLDVRWLAIPGNHDIGDYGPVAQPVTPSRRARYQSVFGDAFWATAVDSWQLVGLDIQTLLADAVQAAPWWDWLEAQLLGAGGPVAVFGHRPVRPLTADAVDSPHRYIPEPARSRLEGLFDRSDVRLVASGHVHQWLTETHGGRAHVWAPATWAVLPDRVQPVIGDKVVGLVEHDLNEHVASSKVHTPSGMAQVAVGDNFPSPYDHH